MKVSKILINVYALLFLIVAFAGTNKIILFRYTAELMAVMGMILIVGLFVSKREFGIAVNKLTVWLYLGIFIFIILDYFFWSIYPENTAVYIKRFIFLLPIMLICISIESIEKVISVSKKYVFLIALFFILLYPMNGVNGSFLGSYQNVGGAISVGLLFFVADFLFKEVYTKKDLFTFVFCVGTLLMTGKRTFSVIPIGLMLFFSMFRIGKITVKEKMHRWMKVFVLAGIAGVIVLAIKPDILLVFTRMMEGSQDNSMSGRKNYWELAMYLWDERKLTGIGMGTYEEYIARNMTFTFAKFKVQAAYAAHNIYFQLLAEVGIVGTFLYLSFFGYNILSTIQLIRNKIVNKNIKFLRIAYLSLLVQIWFLLYGCTGNPLFMVNQLYIYLFAVMMEQAVRREMRKEMNGRI